MIGRMKVGIIAVFIMLSSLSIAWASTPTLDITPVGNTVYHLIAGDVGTLQYGFTVTNKLPIPLNLGSKITVRHNTIPALTMVGTNCPLDGTLAAKGQPGSSCHILFESPVPAAAQKSAPETFSSQFALTDGAKFTTYSPQFGVTLVPGELKGRLQLFHNNINIRDSILYLHEGDTGLITVKNEGGKSVVISTVNTTAPFSGKIGSDGCTGNTLAPNSTCQVSYAIGSLTGTQAPSTVSVVSNAETSPVSTTINMIHNGALAIYSGSTNITSGDKTLNENETGTLEIKNEGGKPVAISAVNISSPFSGKIGSDGCTGNTLAPNATCQVSYAIGSLTGTQAPSTVSVVSNAETSPVSTTINMIHNGALAIYSGSTNITSGDKTLNENETGTLEIKNEGGKPVAISAVNISSPFSGKIGSDGCTGNTLAPNSTCQVSYAIGSLTGTQAPSTVSVVSNAETSPVSTTINMIHNGALAIYSGSTNITSGDKTLNENETGTLEIKNEGGKPVAISAVNISSPFSGKIGSDGCTGNTLAPNSTCQVSYAIGSLTGTQAPSTVSVVSNAETSPVSTTINMIHNGALAIYSGSTNITSGDKTLNENETGTLEIKNEGGKPVAISAVNISSPFSGKIGSDGCTGNTLAPNATCQVSYAIGSLTGTQAPSTVSVVSNAETSPVSTTINMIHNGALAIYSGSTNITSGDKTLNENETGTLEIKNEGGKPVAISAVNISSPFSGKIGSDGCTGNTLAPNATCQVSYAIGSLTGTQAPSTVSVVSNAETSPVSTTINMIHNGALAIYSGSTNITSGDKTLNENETGTLEIKNEGGKPVAISAVNISSPFSGKIGSDGCTGNTLAPNATCQVSYAIGSLTGTQAPSTVSVVSNAETSPVSTTINMIHNGALAIYSGSTNITSGDKTLNENETGTLEIKNEGGKPVAISAVNISSPFSGKIGSDGCTGNTLAPNATCQVSYAIGSLTGTQAPSTVSVVSNAETSPVSTTINMIHNGALAIYSGSTNITSGDKTLNENETGTLEIKNEGGKPVAISAVNISSPFSGKIGSDGCTGNTLAPNSTCQVSYAIGSLTGTQAPSTVSVVSNAETSPVSTTINMIHNGALAIYSGSTNITSGDKTLNENETGTLEIKNEGGKPVAISAVNISSPFSGKIGSDGCTGNTLAPNATCQVSYAIGSLTGTQAPSTVSVVSNAETSPVSTTVHMASKGEFQFLQSNVPMSSSGINIVSSTTPVTGTIELKNVGNQAITNASVVISGPLGNYVTANNCGVSSFAPNQTCTIDYTVPANEENSGDTILTATGTNAEHTVEQNVYMNLLLYYDFVGDHLVGTLLNSPIAGLPSLELKGNPAIGQAGPTSGLDKAIVFPGEAAKYGQVSTPITLPSSATFDFWVKWKSFGPLWPRVLDFGDGTPSNNIIVSSYRNTEDFALEILNGSIGQSLFISNFWEVGTWYHIRIEIPKQGSVKLYKNEQLIDLNQNTNPDIRRNTLPSTGIPSAVRATQYLGKSLWPNDTPSNNDIAEFKVYSYVPKP